jgi:hypothetical protein
MTGPAPGGRPIVHPGKRHVRTEPKPCPTCLTLMTLDAENQWACPKHGRPTRP